ncbi:hypothetical protein [Nonomuraea sp. NEAU-A123]|uniref:hypothetical protein n=1 Tax=Nonomuraea sp. NEAU-A123 TaxID=2839649 RepID=UPI001BE44E12|nr:hypothetical protein [Nonomuraea sp. NEAU-A123]MBT2226247.1 hypothetical protein [Nonomuraea sp. NEAU-A123]
MTEDTPFIRAVIAGGRLTLVESDAAASPDGPPSDDDEEAPRTGPYVDRERHEDAPEPKLRLKATPEFDDAA